MVSESLAFCWDSWAQMGLSHAIGRLDERAADPEALVVFTFEVARHDPRLFDEVLDWLRHNERLISVQRLRNLSRDESDSQVVRAALAWLSRYRSNPRFRSAPTPTRPNGLQPLFLGAEQTWNTEYEPAFLEHGLLRSFVQPSSKSASPDLRLPINFAFRLRRAIGVGSRSEVVRYLLTAPSQASSVQEVAEATAFAKRNVAEALDGLAEAGIATDVPVGNERRYSLDREAWVRLLRLERLPAHRNWAALFSAVRRILRFLADPALDGMSDYMRASVARDLVEAIERDLRAGGVTVTSSRTGGAYWNDFAEIATAATRSLRV